MRKEYDFSKSRKNPYAKQLKSQITIRLDTAAVAYFKQMAAELARLCPAETSTQYSMAGGCVEAASSTLDGKIGSARRRSRSVWGSRCPSLSRSG